MTRLSRECRPLYALLPTRRHCVPGSVRPARMSRSVRSLLSSAITELSMSKRFTVLIADFLDETSIESAVLGDIAELTMARATDESQLSGYLPRADAILVFH